MRKSKRRTTTAICILATLVNIAFFIAATPYSAAAEKVYTFGVVPQFEARKLADIWLPILKELGRQTGFTFKMVGSPQITDFEKSFINEKFDFAYMNPFHSMLAIKQGKYIPLVRDGSRSLFGILVVLKNSPIKNLKELNGKRVAFPAPNALGACLLMRAELRANHGINVKPVFTQTHTSTYLSVVLGETLAGGGVMRTLKNQKPDIRDNLRVLYKTQGVAPHPITAHTRVPEEHRNTVTNAFLEMAKTEKGAEMLSKIPIKQVIVARAEDYLSLSELELEQFYNKTD